MSEAKTSNSLLKLEIVTPDNSLKYEDVYMVVLPGSEGEFGVLQGHISLVTSLNEGVITLYNQENKIYEKISISSGFAEVTSNSVLVLVKHITLLN